MTSPAFAASYRKTAEVYRRRAAETRKKATPIGAELADRIAARWEAQAVQMDMDADEIEAASRMVISDEA